MDIFGWETAPIFIPHQPKSTFVIPVRWSSRSTFIKTFEGLEIAFSFNLHNRKQWITSVDLNSSWGLWLQGCQSHGQVVTRHQSVCIVSEVIDRSWNNNLMKKSSKWKQISISVTANSKCYWFLLDKYLKWLMDYFRITTVCGSWLRCFRFYFRAETISQLIGNILIIIIID